jgi:hypothetical protein
MKTINGKKINEKLRVYVNGKRKTSGGGAAPPNPYQEWSGYPDSPVLTSEYPYQFIGDYGAPYLITSTSKIYKDGTILRMTAANNYIFIEGEWSLTGTNYDHANVPTMLQANADVYADATLTTVWFTKTTP